MGLQGPGQGFCPLDCISRVLSNQTPDAKSDDTRGQGLFQFLGHGVLPFMWVLVDTGNTIAQAGLFQVSGQEVLPFK